MDIFRKYFGKRLEQAMKDAETNQVRLAEKLGINSSAISRWINGHDFPDDSRMPDILKALKVSEDFFIPKEVSPPPTISHLLEAMRSLDEENRKLKSESLDDVLRRFTQHQDRIVLAKAIVTGDRSEVQKVLRELEGKTRVLFQESRPGKQGGRR